MREYPQLKKDEVYEDYGFEEKVEDDYPFICKYKFMQNGLLKVSWVNIKSALVSGLITAVLGVAGYIIGVGDVFKLDVHALVNVGSLTALTAVVSIIKSSLVTNQGNFLGSVKVVE